MVASMVPKERTGVYMGILNMMIVVPMLIETLTFGWIFQNLLGDSGPNAIVTSGALLACGGVAMLWVNDPDPDDESDIMPPGAPRNIATVYDRVVVGSDGTPTSLQAVAHAAGVADAAEARLVIVSAYNPGAEGPSVSGARQELHGEEAARAALRASVEQLERIKRVDTRIVEGDPAHALLDTAGQNPANVIVVGNRGLGAEEGELLGSVPAEIVRHAVCDVLVIQTGEAARAPS